MNNKTKATFVRQQGQSDCGVACLASVIAFHQGEAQLELLRELSGTTQQGTTLLGLFQSAQKLGFDAEGCEAEGIENLVELTNPAILHVVIDDKLLHYIVYYPDQNKTKFTIGDPEKGIIELNGEELDKIWQSKTLLLLTPNESFVKANTIKAQKRQWLVDLIKKDVNILSIATVIGVVISVLGLSTAIFSQKLIDEILPKHDTKKLFLGLVLLFFLLLGRMGLSYIRGFFLNRQSRDFKNRIIERFFGAILHLPKSFFDSRKTGELVARMNDTRRLQSAVSQLSGNLIIDCLVVVITSVFIFNYSVVIAIISLTSIPLYVFLVWKYSKPIREHQKNLMSAYARTESTYIDSIRGISTIKTMNREPNFSELSKVVYSFFQNKIYELGTLQIKFGVWSELIGIVLIASVLGWSSWLVVNKSIQIGQMMAILTMTGAIIPAVGRLSMVNIQLQEAKVAFDRMFEFVSVKPEYEPKETSQKISFESLICQNISFRFAGRKQLLSDFSIEVNKGEFVAIIGESGCGKSTLLQLLQRFYSIESGKILINGLDWNEIDVKNWRNCIGVVPQQVHIFNGTVFENICLGSNTDLGTELEKLVKFCREYDFEPFIETLPQGYLTLVGEEGINLSGGQQQILALARTLYQKPQLLLLDEATASMDSRTERFILKLLQKIKLETAIIFITHRIAPTKLADRIYRLTHGTTVLVEPNELELMET